MRYCNYCQRLTAGQPLFCQFCGRSFDVKLCPRHHANPRTAEFCAECGSRELSTPAPRGNFGLSVLVRILGLIPGVVLLAATVFLFIAFIVTFAQSQQLQSSVMALAVIVSALWLAYLYLPSFLKRLVRSGWQAVKRRIRS